MANNNLENRRKKDSYEIRRNNEIIFYFRNDVLPRWLTRLIWAASGVIVTTIVSYLIKIFTG